MAGVKVYASPAATGHDPLSTSTILAGCQLWSADGTGHPAYLMQVADHDHIFQVKHGAY